MKRVYGVRLLALCRCGFAIGSEVIPPASPPDQVEDLRSAVAELLDEHGNERRCGACGRSLFDPSTKLLIVYLRGNSH